MIYIHVCGYEAPFMQIAPETPPGKTRWFCIRTRSKKRVQQLPHAERMINQSAAHIDDIPGSWGHEIFHELPLSRDELWWNQIYFFGLPHSNCNKTRLMACGALSHLQVTQQLKIPEACNISSNGRNLSCLHVVGTLKLQNSKKPKPAMGRLSSSALVICDLEMREVGFGSLQFWHVW